jgi:hypothetical protein
MLSELASVQVVLLALVLVQGAAEPVVVWEGDSLLQD